MRVAVLTCLYAYCAVHHISLRQREAEEGKEAQFRYLMVFDYCLILFDVPPHAPHACMII